MSSPPSLRELQHAFAGAIVDGAAPVLEPWIAARGIAPAARLRIYRHANLAIHVDALATSFPALQRLLGADCFDGLATRHAAFRGNRSGNLQDYGADFAAFVEAQPETAPWPWLGEVARLEWLRQEVALAADAVPADAAALVAALADADHPPHLRPCVLVLSSAWAVLDLWRHAQAPEHDAIDPAAPQSVLLWREGSQVAMRVIAPAQAAFMHALRRGSSLDQALAAAQRIDVQMPPEALLRPLLEHALLAA
ncbi:DNA-binding domain-containing protein [Rhodanobacter thiooxydans]|uniref:HvfC/BufC N-terminal domain-containing protein n=1 Tax=Rhodanobacter thiooxydans TaxID=416169 RepID=UPI000D34AABA|nr:DNA-binding domain-containing protein [Rhodanobacter thiooxydans]